MRAILAQVVGSPAVVTNVSLDGRVANFSLSRADLTFVSGGATNLLVEFIDNTGAKTNNVPSRPAPCLIVCTTESNSPLSGDIYDRQLATVVYNFGDAASNHIMIADPDPLGLRPTNANLSSNGQVLGGAGTAAYIYQDPGTYTITIQYYEPDFTLRTFVTNVTVTTNTWSNRYVNYDTGSDTNDGTSNTPWQTINYAYDQVNGEAFINLAGGVTHVVTNSVGAELQLKNYIVCRTDPSTNAWARIQQDFNPGGSPDNQGCFACGFNNSNQHNLGFRRLIFIPSTNEAGSRWDRRQTDTIPENNQAPFSWRHSAINSWTWGIRIVGTNVSNQPAFGYAFRQQSGAGGGRGALHLDWGSTNYGPFTSGGFHTAQQHIFSDEADWQVFTGWDAIGDQYTEHKLRISGVVATNDANPNLGHHAWTMQYCRWGGSSRSDTLATNYGNGAASRGIRIQGMVGWSVSRCLLSNCSLQMGFDGSIHRNGTLDSVIIRGNSSNADRGPWGSGVGPRGICVRNTYLVAEGSENALQTMFRWSENPANQGGPERWEDYAWINNAFVLRDRDVMGKTTGSAGNPSRVMEVGGDSQGFPLSNQRLYNNLYVTPSNYAVSGNFILEIEETGPGASHAFSNIFTASENNVFPTSNRYGSSGNDFGLDDISNHTFSEYTAYAWSTNDIQADHNPESFVSNNYIPPASENSNWRTNGRVVDGRVFDYAGTALDSNATSWTVGPRQV